jgi:hypothetical protein
MSRYIFIHLEYVSYRHMSPRIYMYHISTYRWGGGGGGGEGNISICKHIKFCKVYTVSKMQTNLCTNADDTYGYFTLNGVGIFSCDKPVYCRISVLE